MSMMISWDRTSTDPHEFSIVTPAFQKALNFLQSMQDEKVKHRFSGPKNGRRFRSVTTPIILNAIDAHSLSECIVIRKDGVPKAFIDKHNIDWGYISSVLTSLMTVSAVEFVSVDIKSGLYQVRAGDLITRTQKITNSNDQINIHRWVETDPKTPDIQRFQWLRRELILSNKFDNLIHTLALKTIEFDPHTKSIRKDTLRKTELAVRVILANVYRAYQRDPSLLTAVKLGAGDYKGSIYNPLGLGYRGVNRTIRYFTTTEEPYLTSHAGNLDREQGRGHTTRILATDKLIREIETFLSNRRLPEPNAPLTCNTLADVPPYSPQVGQLYDTPELPLIRLRNKNKDLIPYEPTADTNRMQANLRAINQFITQDHWIDILLPDDEFLELSRGRIGQEDDEVFGDRSTRHIGGFDLLQHRSLHRVFNNSSFEHGGRFYGGWWQNIRSHYRKRITINWYPTIEVDYSGMQIAMLYAWEGLQLTEDPYQLEGMPDGYRSLVKTTMLKLINATDKMSYPRRDAYPEGWNWNRLRSGVLEKHLLIGEHFNTGVGVRLQRRDADIAELVMMTLKDEGILALPVHDSFIVRECYEGRLKEVMLQTYKQEMGQRIDASEADVWLEPTPEERELDELGVRSLEETVSDLERDPQYAGYLERKFDVQCHLGDDWLYTHQWFI